MKTGKSPSIFLQHILSAISDIQEYTDSMPHDAFLQDRKTQAAVIRNLEIIGEASKNVPAAFSSKHPGVAWKEAARMRDKLIHGYFGVDAQDVWDAVQNDLPKLKADVQKILDGLGGERTP
jgi:uncharacterized protein with HEPN domain